MKKLFFLFFLTACSSNIKSSNLNNEVLNFNRELSIEEFRILIDKYNKQIFQVKSNKEYDALLKEIDHIEEKNKVFGHNTDAGGFELALRRTNYNVENKIVFILGAGGVAPSIILALKRMGVFKIILSNRTKKKALSLKSFFPDLEIVDWGKTPVFNMIINATSLGLKSDEEIKLDYSKIKKNIFFYDIIYNPKKTKFLLKAERFGNQIENGKMMFLYQAHQAFTVWHKIMPNIDSETISFLDK